MGLTLYLGIERGNIACHKSEARFGTLLREGRLASRAFRDEAFWRSQVNFGPPNPATDEKALWYGVKGSVYVVTLPAFQRCLEDGPDAAERRPGSGFPTGGGGRRRPSQGTSRPTGNTGETWEGNPIGKNRVRISRSGGRPPESKGELLRLSPRETIRPRTLYGAVRGAASSIYTCPSGPLPYVSQFQLWTIPQQRLPLDRNGSNPDMGIGAFD
ncbi:hypothetical protein L1887_50140 [Cichorium endivia]|nr:hypothetical protein L1887_63346 [Cichorium endivia]KAI3476753.1 hypothetical protein L1887_61671 [Cichorium endivia]KAI3476860.1 hypothetical protein L1887_61566 [Cichorium endivia]KAI3476921.1 hypothetical protein L1887_61466 [Cichorium endivia]KAI3477336.1 hypothetical protein L1887_60990 [Cichorium endivia]